MRRGIGGAGEQREGDRWRETDERQGREGKIEELKGRKERGRDRGNE